MIWPSADRPNDNCDDGDAIMLKLMTVPAPMGGVCGSWRHPDAWPPGDNLVMNLDHMISIAKTARSEEHTSELQSLMRISYAVFCLKKKRHTQLITPH